jgi:hypothetical protein
MTLMMRPTAPALTEVGRALNTRRDQLTRDWFDWVNNRMKAGPALSAATLERHLTLLVDALIQMAGPLRRNVYQVWLGGCEFYGQAAAVRGLAAGEVVEEMQHLRELLIRQMAEVVSRLPAKQSMAIVLRLNRVLDKGIAHAVVGYTDALVETLFDQRGVPVSAADPEENEISKRLDQLEAELKRLSNNS